MMFPTPAGGNVPSSSSSSSSTAATYITIPISGTDVIVRSVQNLSSSLSRRRPWPEFLSSGAIDFPSSVSATTLRLRVNFKYFYVNYAILTSASAAASLLGSPMPLILIGILYLLWMVLYFCREDPVLVMGYHVDDCVVNLGLVMGSIAVIWFTKDVLINLFVGTLIGLLVALIHGLLRNTDELYLDENQSVSSGLISASSHQNGETVSSDERFST